MKKSLAYIGTALALPFLAAAQTLTNAQSLGQWVINFINTIAVPVLFAIAFFVFILGIFQYFIMGRGDEEKAQQGRSLMLWGILGFLVMLCVWGLVNIALGTLPTNNAVPAYPSAPTTNQYTQ